MRCYDGSPHRTSGANIYCGIITTGISLFLGQITMSGVLISQFTNPSCEMSFMVTANRMTPRAMLGLTIQQSPLANETINDVCPQIVSCNPEKVTRVMGRLFFGESRNHPQLDTFTAKYRTP